MPLLFASLVDFAKSATASGYLVALAVICLLQYLLHMRRMTVVRREYARCAQVLSETAARLAATEADQRRARHENALVREFLDERDIDRALRAVLRQFAPDTTRGGAAWLRPSAETWRVTQSLGLWPADNIEVEFDANLREKLLRNGPLVLRGAALRALALWNSLPQTERSRVEELHLFPIGAGDALQGALVLKSLPPLGISDDERQSAVSRLVAVLSGSLRDRWAMEAQAAQLHIAEEMLALRAIVDRHHASPHKMIGELMDQVVSRTAADRAALYLFMPEKSTRYRALVRCGADLQAGVSDAWHRQEDRLALAAAPLRESREFDVAQLARLNIDALVRRALVVPVVQNERTIGAIILARGNEQKFGNLERHLTRWSCEMLAEALPRIANQSAVARKARLDALTQLANRGSFDEQLASEITAARASGTGCVLLLIDLDRFKTVNDRYGHRGGDEVLRCVAAQLRECAQQIRAGDVAAGAKPVVARYGGEELAVVLPRMTMLGGRRIGELIRTRVAAQPVRFEGQVISVTASLGLACYPEHGESPEELLAAADAALYQAKRCGRNRLETAEQPAAAAS